MLTKKNNQKRYLIVAPAWVGDMVMAHTLVQLLAKQFPDATIDILAPEWTLPIAAVMPEISQAIALPFKRGELNLKARRQFAKTLQSHHYTDAIVLPNSFKSALIPWWANIPNRIGWLGEYRWGILNDWRHLNKTHYPLMIERFMALANPDRQLPKTTMKPLLKISEKTVTQVIKKFSINLDQGRPFILAPGAEYGEAKRWPPEYYAALAQKLNEQGHPVWILGSPNDKILVPDLMLNQSNQCRNFIGETNLEEAMALLSLARFVICNDSGLMHITAALDKPLLAIFGSSDQRFTPPLSEKAKILSLKLSCSPCFKRTCPLTHLNCLKKLTPQRVFETINQWIKICAS